MCTSKKKKDTKAVQQSPSVVFHLYPHEGNKSTNIKAVNQSWDSKALFLSSILFFFILLVLVLAEREVEDQQDNVVKGDRGQMLPAGL